MYGAPTRDSKALRRGRSLKARVRHLLHGEPRSTGASAEACIVARSMIGLPLTGGRMPETTSTRARHVWHQDLHRLVAKERLHYWLIEMQPYDSVKAVDAIVDAMTSCRIRSYAAWELIGQSDILLKAWQPNNLDCEEVREAISARTMRTEIDAYYFQVQRPIRHWMWQKPIDEQKFLFDVPGELLRSTNVAMATPTQLRSLEESGYIGDTKIPRKKLIQFFMRFESTKQLDQNNSARLEEEILESLAIENCYHGHLYRGNGISSHLLAFRLPLSHYELVSSHFAKVVGRLSLDETLNVRSITHTSGLHEPLVRREQLLPCHPEDSEELPDDQVADLATQLETGESGSVEIKGSAFTDVGRRIRDRVKAPKSNVISDNIVKAVAGLLNARGGRVIVGALENDAFSPTVVQAAFPDAKAIGNLTLIGVGAEWRNWDHYERRIRELLQNQIHPSPATQLDLNVVSIDAGIDLLTIDVPQGQTHYWATMKSKQSNQFFFVRMGMKTESLVGNEFENHRNANPRPTPWS